jgi:hypothetical protein
MATKQQGQHMIALEILSLSLRKTQNWLHQIVIHMFSKEISHISLATTMY